MSDQAADIAELQRQVAALTSSVAQLAGRPAGEVVADPNTPSVPLKQAAHRLGISEEAALKRAQRAWRHQLPGVGRYGGRWYFSPAYIGQNAHPGARSGVETRP